MKIKQILPLIILAIFIISPICNANNTIDENIETYTIENNTENKQANILEQKLDILSETAILIDNKTGKTIYSKNENKKMYPASTTKVLTAIIAIENGNLNDITTVSNNAISLIPYGYSAAYFSEGETISVRSLLETLLVHSANDAANVLAEYISGSIDAFVDLMNKKANELGCTNTHFVNTNGIHNEDHYSTASDLAIIAKYCMQNPTFRNIVSMKSCTIPATNKYGLRIYTNTNDSIIEKSKYYRKDVVGIKTGYTSEAKNCIISAAKKGDTELIAVLLYSPHLVDRYTDLDTLYEYGYKVAPLLAKKEEEQQNEQKTLQEIQSTDSHSLFSNIVNNDNFIIILRIALGVVLSLILILIIFKIIRIRK